MRTTALRLFACLTVFACNGGGGPTDPSAAVISRIEVTPALKELLPGDMQQFAAALFDANGVLVSGPQVTWEVDDATVASVGADGLVQAMKPGEVTLFARSGTASGVAIVRPMMPRAGYTLRTVNGLSVPAVITDRLSCAPGEPSTRLPTVRVEIGLLAFGASPFTARPDWHVDYWNCVGARTSSSGALSQTYIVRGNTIIFGAILGNHSNILHPNGWGAASGRLSNDSIFVRWKARGFPTDSLDFVYVKQ